MTNVLWLTDDRALQPDIERAASFAHAELRITTRVQELPPTPMIASHLTRNTNVITMYVHSLARYAMSTVIKTRLVKIGNSQGVRIPKLVLDQLNLSSDIELEVQDNHLILRSSAHPRADWAGQFRQIAERGDDKLLDADATLTEWDGTEWQW